MVLELFRDVGNQPSESMLSERNWSMKQLGQGRSGLVKLLSV
jgi:hypothetical protein